MLAFCLALTIAACTNNPTAPFSSASDPALQVASVELKPVSLTLETGQSTLLHADVKDNNGNDVNAQVEWSTSNASVATVDSTGTVRATGSGKVMIKASSHGKGSHSKVKVDKSSTNSTTTTSTDSTSSTSSTSTDSTSSTSSDTTSTTSGNSGTSTGTLASITVSPQLDTLAKSETVNLTAVPRDASGQVLTGVSMSWSSSNTSVATVDAGLVTARAAGSATIKAYSGSISGASSVVVTVDTASSGSSSSTAVVSVQVTPSSVTLGQGQTTTLTATPLDANGDTVYGVGTTWSSSNQSVATVSGGSVTAESAGTATIVALAGGVSGTATVTVPDPPVSAASGTGDHANEPAAYVRFLQSDFANGLPSGANQTDGEWYTGNGWGDISTPSLTGPDGSAVHVLQWKYPNGWVAGRAPGSVYSWDCAAQASGALGCQKRAIYLSVWIRFVGNQSGGDVWENNKTGTKMFYLPVGAKDGQSHDFFMLYNGGSTPRSKSQFQLGWDAAHYSINDTRTFEFYKCGTITINHWHHIEMVLVENDFNVQDGVARIWIDGTLTFNHADMGYRGSRPTAKGATDNDAGFYQYHGSPVYGGGGDSVTLGDQYFQIYDLYVSGINQ